MSSELGGFDEGALRELLEERLAAGQTGSLDHDLRELCGCWTVALDWSPQTACRAGVEAATVARSLARLHRLMTGLDGIYLEHPLPAAGGRVAALQRALAASWILVAQLDASPERFVDALCWYFEAMGEPLPRDLESEVETLILDGLYESEPTVLLLEVSLYVLHSLDGEV